MNNKMSEEERDGWSYCRDTDVAIVVGVESVVADYMKHFPPLMDGEDKKKTIPIADLDTDELMQDVWGTPTPDEKSRVLLIAFSITDKDILQWGKNSVYRPRENIIEVKYSDTIKVIELVDAELKDIYSGTWDRGFVSLSPDERKCELLTLRKSIVDKIDKSRLNDYERTRDLAAYSVQREA